MKTEELKAAYELCCERYCELFAAKNGYEFNGWVGGFVGGMAYFGDYCISFDDIRVDVDGDAPVDELLRYIDEDPPCNYRTWLRTYEA